MNIIDNNLKLRAIELKDASLLRDMINNPEIERMVVGWSYPVSEQQQIIWINNLNSKDIKLIIEYNDVPIGMASLTGVDFKNSIASVNIKINDSEYKSKGIGTKVILLLIKYCFEELNLNCLTCSILEYNIPSQRLFEKCGFTKEGILRSRVYKQGKYNDIYVYSLLRSEYMK